MSPAEQPVALRFADVRVRVAFHCRDAADGMLPALAHARDESLDEHDAAITVQRRVDDGAELAWWERATPLRLPLSQVLGTAERRVVHAGVVGDERGGLALVGPPGSGKTTTALAAVRAGLGFVADDYVLLRAGPPFEAVCLYSTACVRAGADDGTKQVVDVGSDALRRALPIRAVAVTRLCGGDTRWRRTEAAVALRAWAPSTTLLTTGDRGAAMPLLAGVVRAVPCYTLDVGDDPVEVGAAVDAMLDRGGLVTCGLVSVVMPAFDEEAFIGEAIASVLAQTYAPFELIVVDDGSSDRTAAIAAACDGVRVVSRPRRGGPAAARNAGLAAARSAYWTIFDADDVMPPDRLAIGMEHLAANPSVGLVLGLTEAFVTPGEPRPPHWNPAWDGGPYYGHPGTALGRWSVLDQVGLFDEALDLGADMQWLARAKRAGVAIGRADELFLRYRIHAGNVTADVSANRANMLTALRTARSFR